MNRRQILAVSEAGGLATVTALHPERLRSMFGRVVLISASVVCGTAIAAAQPVAPAAPAIEVVPFLRDVTRVESWSFFEPHSAGGDPEHHLFSNRATLGVRVNTRRFFVNSAFQYAQVLGLPRHATGPGPLGPGAMYYDAAHTPAAFQLYFKALSLRVNEITAGVSAEAGRMGFGSGLEGRSASPAIEAVKRARLGGRLIGEVEWSTFERAFDGVRVDVDRPRWHTTAALLWPTQGAFEESANATIDKVRVATTSVIAKRRSHELELFASHYRDSRDITVRPDNTALPAIAADISVATVGTSHVGVYPAGPGRADTLLWVSAQAGDWYGNEHRAWSMMAEGGYQWTSAWQPWVRAGWQYASGDGDPADFRHSTFFPLLPSTRPDLLAATFAQMNLRDVFTHVQVTPHARLTLRGSVDRLSLANARDRWYSGTGATERRGSFFGFVGRLSSGATGLGTLLQVSAAGTVTKWWTVEGSLGTVKGRGAVGRLFAGDRLTVFLLESAFAFSRRDAGHPNR